MTTVIPFIPSNISAPKFNATFDGIDYEIRISWNVSAQRFYVNVYGLDGTWIVTVPLITTPPGRAVNSAVWDPLQRLLIVTMYDPSTWPIPLSPYGTDRPGTVLDYTLSGFQPNTYNGKFRSLQVNPITFTTPMNVDPGPIVVAGYVDRLLNMVAGVFKTSTLVYRNSAFEINP